MESLESLCLDTVTGLIPILAAQLRDLPVGLLKCLLPRCKDYQLAIIHKIALEKGLDMQPVWQDLCRSRFSWFYRHKFRPNLHDAYWLCCVCQKMTSCGLPADSEGIEWHQTYLDKKCEGNLENMRTRYSEQTSKRPSESINEETKMILQNPLALESGDLYTYTPRQLLLNIKTVIALTKSPWALGRLAHSLETLMCRVQVPTEYRDLARTSVERFLQRLLLGGTLRTLYLKEQQVMRGEAMDYSHLFDLLLRGGTCAHPKANSPSGGGCKGAQVQGTDEKSFLESRGAPLDDLDLDSATLMGDENDDKDEFSNDLYDFCFKEPVKIELANFLFEGNSENDDVVGCDSRLSTTDLFCEEGAGYVDATAGCSTAVDVVGTRWKDNCVHFVDPDTTYFSHIPRDPNPGVVLGWSISNLVLVYVRLSAKSCTALSNGLAQSLTLHSLALIQCVMPPCGWCEILSGLAAGARGGLLLRELALTCAVPTHRAQPQALFGQYCAQKLNEILETYLSKDHKMESLKLELLLSNKCQAAETSFLPKYLSSISRFSISCWGFPFPSANNSAPHPLCQLVPVQDLAAALPSQGSVLTDLLLDNCSLGTAEVDMVLAAAAHAPCLKRVSVTNNRYSTPQPRGLLALLRHTGLFSLNICQCKFSLKACEQHFQDRIVEALINNCSLQHLNFSDRILDDEDLKILARGFSDTRRTLQDLGYCLNICLSPFSWSALEMFGETLARDTTGGRCRSNRRPHSLDHLALDWRCVTVIRTLKKVIPKVTCPHRLS